MDNKRQALLDSALLLFNEKGFEATPTAAISRQAGVATGTLFNIFTNKEGLINALYLECKTAMIRFVFGQEKEMTNDLAGLFTRFVRWGLEETGRYLFFQQYCNSRFITEETRERGLEIVQEMHDGIHAAQDTGLLKKMDTDLLLQIAQGIIRSVTNTVLARPGIQSDQQEEIILQGAKVFIDALGA